MFHLYQPKNQISPWKNEFAVACSGGFDSMAITEFFVRGRRKPILLHVNHSTGNDAAQTIVEEYAAKNDLQVIVFKVNPDHKDKSESWEEFWRNQRLAFFHSMVMPVITGHNLNDAMETWMFSSMHGNPSLIPYSNKNVYRPFIMVKKDELKRYAVNHNISWAEDNSNNDVKYARNRIRHRIIPEVLEINKGFASTIKKKYLALRAMQLDIS